VGLQPVMEPRFLGRSARSLISTLDPSISYRLEAWPLKILYWPYFLYGSAQFVGQTTMHVYCAPLRTADSCTAISLPYRIVPAT